MGGIEILVRVQEDLYWKAPANENLIEDTGTWSRSYLIGQDHVKLAIIGDRKS